MALLDTLGLSSSSQDALAAKAAAAQEAAAKKGAKKEAKVTKKGYAQAQEALAPAITAAGDYLTKQNQGYDVYRGALGLTGQAGADAAESAYRLGLQPGLNQSLETIRRQDAGAGRFGSGALATDFGDYIFNSQYDPWRESLKGFDPLAATQQVGQFGTTAGNWDVGQGRDLTNIYTNKFNTLGAAKAGLYQQQAANQGQVGQNILGLAGGLLGAGSKLFGMYGAGGGYDPSWNTVVSR